MNNYYMETHEAAEQIDEWIRELNEYKKELSDVLKARYLASFRIPTKTVARTVGVNVRTFEDRLSRGRMWIMSRLCVSSGCKTKNKEIKNIDLRGDLVYKNPL